MKERILEFLKNENKTSSQFADEIGVQPSSVSHIISGRNKPSLDFIIKMLQKYDDLSTDWLIFGKGNMYKEQISGDLFAEFDSDLPENPSSQTPPPDMSNAASASEAPSPSLSLDTVSKGKPSSNVSQLILVYTDNTFRVFDDPT